MTNPRIRADAGGELGARVAALLGKTFECKSPVCESIPTRVIEELRGYEQKGGLPDADAVEHWLYFECPVCQSAYSEEKLARVFGI